MQKIKPQTTMEHFHRDMGFQNGWKLGLTVGILFAAILATVIFH